jgi:hypothetical protein
VTVTVTAHRDRDRDHHVPDSVTPMPPSERTVTDILADVVVHVAVNAPGVGQDSPARHDSQWNLSSSVEGDYIWRLRVTGHADILTDTAVTVDAPSDHHPMIGAGPDSPARSREIR